MELETIRKMVEIYDSMPVANSESLLDRREEFEDILMIPHFVRRKVDTARLRSYVDSLYYEILLMLRFCENNVAEPIAGCSVSEVEAYARECMEEELYRSGIFDVKLGCVVLYGSRCRGLGRPDSDIDILVEYFCEERQMKEYDLFNLFHAPDCMQRFMLGGKVIDINPITRDKSGSIGQYLCNAERYLDGKSG